MADIPDELRGLSDEQCDQLSAQFCQAAGLPENPETMRLGGLAIQLAGNLSNLVQGIARLKHTVDQPA
jgi:hypothetical protein